MQLLKKLDIFILKKFITLFCGTFFICLFIFMMQFLWRYVDELIGKGLEISVLAQFFFYSALTLVPMSLPLAILLASLISFGNLGEQFELLAIKAAGISLFKTIRPLVVFVCLLGGASFYFQNVVGPKAQLSLFQLIISMKQTSPELDIPEKVFYNEISGYNLYVEKKDKETGILHGVIIYNVADGFENAHIILADSGKLEMSSDQQHLLLHLYSGEQFENLRGDQFGQMRANVPYRRETFCEKHTIIDFNSGFNMTDADLSGRSAIKNMAQLDQSIDSMTLHYDSVGIRNYKEVKISIFQTISKKEQAKADKYAKEIDGNANIDTAFSHLTKEAQVAAIRSVYNRVRMQKTDFEFKKAIMEEGDFQIRKHKTEWHRKISLALACVVFFFIGAPLGAIIRKGGLGMPVIVSVIIFIFYYIIDNSGYKMARDGEIPVVLGMWISTFILAPMGLFLTYKANNDSAVFNKDAYANFFRKLLGLRLSRHVARKEVIIYPPNYDTLPERLNALTEECEAYSSKHRLIVPPNPLRIFLRNRPDVAVEEISERMEALLEELGNTKDTILIGMINEYPILAVSAHTSPFGKRWKNLLSGLCLPLGIILYLRIWRFRRRLYRDMKKIVKNNNDICVRIGVLRDKKLID